MSAANVTDSGYGSASRLTGVPVLSDYADVRAALKARTMCPANHDGESAPFVGGTLITLHGDDHRRLRLLEAGLFTRDALVRYEHDVLAPVVERTLARLAGRVDLVALTRSMLLQIAATIIGLDDVVGGARTDRLGACMDRLIEATHVEWSTGDRDRIAREAEAALEIFDREYVQPSLRRRAAAAQPEDRDLLALLLADGALDGAAIVREAVLYLVAATVTTSTLVTHTVDEVARWCEARPRDAPRRRDPRFLRDMAEEALRLHVPTAALLRRAIEPTELPTGIAVPVGETVACDLAAANRDGAVFGHDADRFEPGRGVGPGIPAHGLAFGAGPHICIGRFLALPAAVEGDAVVGIVVRILRGLYDAGMAPDPEHAPVRLDAELDGYAEYPVRFPEPGGGRG